MTQHPYDELEAFALGDLDKAAAEAVLRHADACPTCAAALADSMRGVAALATAESSHRGSTPTPLVLRRPLRRRWLVGLATSAALLLGAWNFELRATMPVVPVDALVHSHFIHHPLTGGEGNAKIIQAVDGTWLYLVADGLRPFGRYRLTVDGEAVGSASADASGRLTGYWTHPTGKIAHVLLTAPSGSALRWNAK